jgi:serine-type D-Ala-D-Ala carboxypeptidase (penicillin-binding protein 5/6)
MNLRTYIAGCTAAAYLFTGILLGPADAANSSRQYPAYSYLLQINGETIREKNADRRLAPASLTKMMTALIVIESCQTDEVVKVSSGAARETGSRIGLRRGERYTVKDLLAATLMASANDACRALADHVAGSQRNFVVRMNARARTLKMYNTRFTNVCGHDNAALYSTAQDLAILADHALKNPLFADLVSRRTMRIATVNRHRGFVLRNKNRLIGNYPGASGVKTGTTPNAGQCLVAVAKRGDRRVLLVIMKSRNRWRAAPAMLDAAFALNSSAVRKNTNRGNNEAPPQGTVVRD